MSFARSFIKNNTVLIIAVSATVLSSFFNDFSFTKLYSYIDVKTIVCLFCIMAVLEGCKNIKLFRVTASYLLKKFSHTRKMVFALVFITYFFSMFIANDMALITFLPFTYMVLGHTKNVRLISFTIIMQNIAANLGGMLTPFGNPQNLYLYSYYQIPSDEFLFTMLPPFLLSFVLLTVCCLFVKNKPIDFSINDYGKINVKKTLLYSAMFLFTVLTVFRIFDFLLCLVIISVLIILTDIKALKSVDYSLLFTFLCFFIFSGNMSNIGFITGILSSVISRSPFFSGIISCQIISNVPTAALFSKFVDYNIYPELLWAVNIGGMGTPVASLASLISLKSFSKQYKSYGRKYLFWFLIINFAFLAVYILLYIISNIS